MVNRLTLWNIIMFIKVYGPPGCVVNPLTYNNAGGITNIELCNMNLFAIL